MTHDPAVVTVQEIQALARTLTEQPGAAMAACLIAGVELAIEVGVAPATVLEIVMMGYKQRGLVVDWSIRSEPV